MARKIIWSQKAALEKDRILYFWLHHNQSNSYPKKLNKLFHQAAKWLAKNPMLGRKTSLEGIRVKLVRDYFMFYEFDKSTLKVLTIWDTRRNPEDIPYPL